MTGLEKTQLLKQIDEFSAAEPNSARDHALSDLIIELVDEDPAPALLILWHRLAIERDIIVGRSMSFAMSRHSGSIGILGCPVLSAFLSSPVIADAATLLNTIGAVSLADTDNPVVMTVLQSDLGAFVVRCVTRVDVPVDIVVDLLVRVVDLGIVKNVFTKADIEVIRNRIDSAIKAESSDLLVSDWKSIQQELRGQFPEAIRLDQAAIENAVLSPAWVANDDWKEAFEPAAEAGKSSLRDLVLLDRLSAEAAGTNTAVQQLHLLGPTAIGRLAIGAYTRLLTSWRRLFETAFSSVDSLTQGPRAPLPPMFVLAPQPSSFVIRVIVDTGLNRDLAASAFARAAEAIQFGPADDKAGVTDALSNAVEGLYSVLQSNHLDVSISMDAPGSSLVRARTRLTHRLADRATKRPPRPKLALLAQQVIGTLEAANHLTGRVEIGLQEHEPISAELHPSKRGDLLNRVIGKQYTFSIEPRPADDQVPWLLIAIEAIEEADEGVDESELLPAAHLDKLTSDVVPQQDRLDRVIQVVRLLAAGKAVSPATMGMKETSSSVRHIGYMKQAAKILRLISEGDNVRAAGRTLVTLPTHRVIAFLALQFETTPVGRAWLKWAGAKDVSELKPEGAEAFLRDRSVLSDSMIERRGRTLRKWVQVFRSIPDDDQTLDDA